jgi:PelA/Pel-15E family pectate lyase
MRPSLLFSLILVIASGVGAAPAPIDTRGFGDSTHHWRRIKEPERVMQPLPDQPSYAPEQVREIADNVLLFQRANGGWPKDYDMLAILTAEQKKAVRDSQARNDTTFDNHTTHSQVDYLARVFAATGNPVYRDACVRGLDFMLAAQHVTGGFPQKWPSPKGFSAHITFNDGVMIGILTVLKDAADVRPHFAWLDAPRRQRVGEAVRRGVATIVTCQTRVGGALTAWGQQHDEKTLAPAAARTFELASHSPQDTTDILRFLMTLDVPSPDIVRAVDAAVAWLRRVKLSGIRIERIKAPPVEFFRHNTDFDVVVVKDEAAPAIWARSYEIGTDRPIFASRDGVKVYSLAEVDRERRTGSGWYGNWPQRLIEQDYPKWQQRIGLGDR